MGITAEILTADQRCPCILVLDASGSMEGTALASLNEGLQFLEKSLKSNPLAARRIEVAVLTFGRGGVALQQPFVMARHFTAPILEAGGESRIGEAVLLALVTLRTRLCEYRALGIQYYRPWLLLITDGEPGDDGWEDAAAQLRAEDLRKGVSSFAIAVGDGVDMATLALFSNKPPMKLRGLDFEELFVWLSGSLGKVSVSVPGPQIELPPIDSWAKFE